MKTTVPQTIVRSHALLAITAALLTSTSLISYAAVWEGADDFSSGISATNWSSYQNYVGDMTVEGVNGHASFLVPVSATTEQNAFIVWRGTPTAAEDWVAEVRGHNSAFHESCQLQFAVVDTEAWNNSGGITVNAFKVGMENDFSVGSFSTSWWHFPSGSTGRAQVGTTSTDFRLRFVYRAASQTVEAWYDPTATGQGWQQLDSMTLNQISPGMTATSTFSFAILANTDYGPIPEGEIWAGDFQLAVLAGQSHANLNGSDNFNDNFKDPLKWGPDIPISGCGGALTETNGRLEFTKSSGCSSALVLRPWILNYGSYTQNWEVQADVSVPDSGFEESTFGLAVASGTNTDFGNMNSDSNNNLQLSLFQSDTSGRDIRMRFRVRGSTDFPRVAEADTTSTYAGLRIAFDASTKVLSTFYDEDGPNNGYSWTLLGSTNVSIAWNMTSTNVFGVFAFGRAEADVVASTDNLFGDNFYASSEDATTAQPPLWLWARRVASTVNEDTELTIGLALDNSANIYVTGWFDGTNDFGGVIRTNTPGGGQDAFAAKFDSHGVLQWADSAGGSTTNRDTGRGIGVDTNGNVYVTGGFFAPAHFGPNNPPAYPYEQFWISEAKGWFQQSVGGDGVYGTGLAVGGSGDCYAVGYADNGAAITFGGTNLTSAYFTGYSTFLVKYHRLDHYTSTLEWARLLDSPDACYSTAVALDLDGNVYVSGDFRSLVTLGPVTLTNAGDKDGFVAKFDSSGAFQWARQLTGPSDAAAMAVSADNFGDVYVAGGFGNGAGDTITFAPFMALTNAGGGAPGSGIGDAFLAKYEASSGAIQWARRFGDAGADGFTGVSTDTEGNIYVGGGTGATNFPASLNGFNAVVAKYNSQGGLQWQQSSTGNNATFAFAGPQVDASGNCYVAGWFQTNATFSAHALTGNGYWDFFLAKLGSTQLSLGILWSNAVPWLSISGEISNRFVLEYAAALTSSNHWQSLGTNTLTSLPFIFPDTNAAWDSTRFYRARLLP